MADIVHWFDELQYRRALRRETNPLDIYDDVELYDRFRLPRNSLTNLINELRGELEHATRRQRAIPAELQVLVALRLLSSGSFQNLVGDMVNIDKTNKCRIIRRVVLSLKLQRDRACDVIQAYIVSYNNNISINAVGVRPDEDAIDQNQDVQVVNKADVTGRVARRQLIQNVFH
ncbi:hypothetical protein KUTeg_014694 [Tegillarca granosa]|uniref:Uncharacterized protein n=1 Tax=Tegillarca granosa TaxID=220873 RepID=A0ABQ9ERW1_TEGGR|nr:hypothetical protein KUTeg_014694 [Tegillarca granosa]